jgi:hypothetical protein
MRIGEEKIKRENKSNSHARPGALRLSKGKLRNFIAVA